MGTRLLMLVTEDWYFRSHRLDLARALIASGYDVHLGTHLNAPPELMTAAGVQIHALPFDRSLRNPLGDIRALQAIRRLHATLQPDLVHLVAHKPALLGGLALHRAPRLPVLTAFAGLGYLFTSPDRKARVLRPPVVAALRRILRRPDRWVLVQNADDAGVLDELGIGAPERRRVVAGSGVDTARFCPAPLPSAHSPPGTARVLFAGRLLRDKGVTDLVAAARLLRTSHPQVRIRLAGACDPDNPSALPSAQVEQWVREGIVEWDGPVADITAAYAANDIVCLPSYREGLPKVLLEAAACGRALVATDVPGCREVCRHDETGLLVPARNPAALAAAIAALADDPVRSAALGSRGRELALSTYSVEVISAQMRSLYATMQDNLQGRSGT